jgi:uncharacterized protein (TIGR03067 family)
MNTLTWIIDGSFSTKLTLALLHFLWQGCAGGVIVIVGGWLLRGAAARSRYVLNVATMLVMAACLPVTFLLLETPDHAVPIQSHEAPTMPVAHIERPDSATIQALPEGPAAVAVQEPAREPEPVTGTELNELDRASTTRSPVGWLQALSSTLTTNALPALSRWVAMLYLTGVTLILGRLLRGVWGGDRLRKMATPIQDAELLQMVSQLANRLGLKVVPTIAWCEQISIPVVVGIITPMILLPMAVASGLTPHQLQALLLHELSHIRRFDPVVNLLQRIVEAALFFHPVVWFVSRRISIERELAADDMVLAAGWDRPLYADTLVRVAELASTITGSDMARRATILGASGTNPSEFKTRVLRLLDESPPPKLNMTRVGMAVTLLLVVGGTIAWSQSDKRNATPAPINPAENNADVAKPIDDAIEVTGRVTDARDEPVAKALVVYPFIYDLETATLQTAKGETDQTGTFRLVIKKSDIPPGSKPGLFRATVWAWADGHAIGVAHAGGLWDLKTGTLLNRGKPISIQLPDRSQSVFVVKTETGKPLANATVLPMMVRVPNGDDPIDGLFGLYDRLPDVLMDLTKRVTGADGRALIDGIPRSQLDSLQVVSSSHGTQSVTLVGQAEERELPLRAVGSLSGQLVGGPAELLRGVQLHFSTSASRTEGIADVITDQSGSFHVPAIAEGFLRIDSNLNPELPWKINYANRIAIVAGRENELLLDIEKGIPVTGRLVVQGSDKTVAKAEVSISSGSFTNHQNCTTDERGEFQTFIVPGHDADIQVINLSGTSDLTFPVPTQTKVTIPRNVGAFRIPDIEIARAKTWTGRLIDQSGRPIVGKYVQAFDHATPLDHPARTDTDGAFKLRLREDQIPNRWSALIKWGSQSGFEKEALPAEIVTADQLVLRVKLPDDTTTFKKPPLLLPDHWIVTSVGFDNDAKELVTASIQSFVTIRRWDLVAQKLISEVKLESDKHGRDLRGETLLLSADRRKVIGATDAYIGIWETATGKLLKQLLIPKDGNNDTVRLLTCTPDFSVIVGNLTTQYSRLTLRYDAHTVVWDGTAGKLLRVLTHKNQNDLIAISLSADGKRFATTNGVGARIWDVGTGEQLLEVKNDNSARKNADPDTPDRFIDNVWSIRFSPDGRQLAMGDTLGVKLIDATSGELLRQLEGSYRYSGGISPGLVYSPDGQMLARLGTRDEADYIVPIWSTQTGQRLFELHTQANDAAFSRDGQRFAVGFSDLQQALTVWQLNRNGSDPDQTEGPGPEPRQDKVEQNGHYRGEKAAEFIASFKPTWSDTKDGVQYGIALTTPQHQFHRGERVPLVAFFRNGSDKPIKIDTRPDYFGNMPKITDAKGTTVELENIALVGYLAHYVETLAPGEAVGPFYFNFGLGENPRPGKQHWHPYYKNPALGTYKLTHTVSVNVGGPNNSDQATTTQITSSQIVFEIVDGKSEETGLFQRGSQAPPNPKPKPRTELPTVPDVKMATELDSFQGNWAIESLDSAAPAIKISYPQQRWRWSIKGSEVVWGRDGQQFKLAAKLDPSTSPGQIDFTFLDGPNKGETCSGIYEWNGDQGKKLRIRIQDPGAKVERPTNFEMTPGSQTSLIVLRPIPPVDPVKELASFQGMWCFDVLQIADWPQPIGIGTDSDGRTSEKRMVVKGNQISWTDRQGEHVTAEFTIDPFKTPKQIDFTFIQGRQKGQKAIGIYEPQMGNDKFLWLCMTHPGSDAPRPIDVSASSFKQQSMIGMYQVAPPEKPSAAKALERFQGLWNVTLCDSALRTYGATQQEAEKWKWTIKGDEVLWSRQGQVWKLKLEVDPSKRPREMDLTYLTGPFQGEKCLGMYEFGGIDEQSLLITIQDPGAKVPRPQAIEMSGSSQTGFIFLRPNQPSESDRQIGQFHGTWTLRNYDTRRNSDKSSWPLPTGKGPDKSGNGSELRWVVKGNEITWINKSGEEIKASFTIDPRKRPKQIDLTFLTGPDKGETCPGIYQRGDFDENILWLCLADPGSKGARPKEFAYQWGEGRSLLSLYPD